MYFDRSINKLLNRKQETTVGVRNTPLYGVNRENIAGWGEPLGLPQFTFRQLAEH